MAGLLNAKSGQIRQKPLNSSSKHHHHHYSPHNCIVIHFSNFSFLFKHFKLAKSTNFIRFPTPKVVFVCEFLISKPELESVHKFSNDFNRKIENKKPKK